MARRWKAFAPATVSGYHDAMLKSAAHSLLLQIGLIMLALTMLAVSSMITSVFVARTIEGEATAVNVAGSLRMQCYRIATQLLTTNEVDENTHWQKMQGLVQAFEGKLYGPGIETILPDGLQHEVRHSYESVKSQWEQEIRPLLNAYIDGIMPSTSRPALARRTWGMMSDLSVVSLRERYLARVSKFVERIDRFVTSIEQDAETKTVQLRAYQWIALVLTFAIVLLALVFSHRRIVIPLRRLLDSAEAARRGDFSARTPHTGRDELGLLGVSFNNMSGNLSSLYADLEERVRIKTLSLEQSNRSLDVLYKTVSRLNSTTVPHLAFQELLKDVTSLAGTGPAMLCLKSGDRQAHRFAATRAEGAAEPSCLTDDCGKCLGKGARHDFDLRGNDGTARKILSLPIKDSRTHHGVLLVEAVDERGFAAWQERVLEAVAQHIGMAIAMSGLHAERSRVALLEERGTIARELHDSLAQSLSYARIQVSRLDSALVDGTERSEAQKISDELREGLSRAYRELRELLTTFRLTMDDHDLGSAIRETVAEFGKRGGIAIGFVGECPDGLLSPSEEIHVLQILREALSNVLRHARAKSAGVVLRRSENGSVELVIQDDGKGIEHAGAPDERQHYGLVIMRERALTLGGELVIDSRPDFAGTRIALRFTPSTAGKTMPQSRVTGQSEGTISEAATP